MKIILDTHQKLFFTSDTHYNHSNICRSTSNWKTLAGEVNIGSTRDYASLEEMNTALVTNINDLVGENDILIHLGDWSFGGIDFIREFREQIKCKNIHLVLGNHDHHIKNNKNNVQSLFSSVHDYLALDIRIVNKRSVQKINIICMHYPIASWDGLNRGTIHLHGHVHLPVDKRLSSGKAMDVGVDGNAMCPISLLEILSMMKTQPIKRLSLPVDHHEEDF